MTSAIERFGGVDERMTDGQEIPRPEVWRYDSSRLNDLHIDAAILPRVPARYAKENYRRWYEHLGGAEDKLGYLAEWIKATIHEIPGGIDVARDVDDGGFTKDKVEPTLFTPWVTFDGNTYVRFSESRTASHGYSITTKGIDRGGALRSPVMAGVALEATSDPESTDPRDAVTLAIYGFAKREDANYPWLSARPGQLFDMTQFTDSPYTVGPLYGGHPNEVTEPQDIDKAVEAAVHTLRITVGANTANQ